ncbi:MAG: PHP domain-containing protein [Deltaproteobacteria bacterium]|nr:MAG: PHP domain-containing protein [Deltaproteobacteria bacterium]
MTLPVTDVLEGRDGPIRIELHCHSTHSDGSESAAAVAARARAAGVVLFALTDHDTLAGGPEVEGAAPLVVEGIELSCRDRGRSVHVLGYGIGHGEGRARLEAKLAEIARARVERIHAICQRLALLGIQLDCEEICARAEGRTVGRPDVAWALVEAGFVRDTREAFDRYLADGAPAYVPVERLSVAEGLELLQEAGAVCALAHPHVYDDEHLEALLGAHAGAGLSGLECHYASYDAEMRRRFVDLAERHGLVPTGGSDFHGALKPDVADVGVEVPLDVARRILAWLRDSAGFAVA